MKKFALPILAASLLCFNVQAADEASGKEVASATNEQPANAGNAGMSPEEIAEMQKKLNNPLADLWLLFFQNDYTVYNDGHGDEYQINNFKFQPVMSFDFSENYNLIVRPTIQHMSLETPDPSSISGVDEGGNPIFDSSTRTSGFGDVGGFAAWGTKEPVNGWILGAGVTTLLPTAAEKEITTGGYDQIAAGPVLIALKVGDVDTYGVVAQHFDGYGDSAIVDRHGNEEDLNLTDIQYIYRHKISPTMQVGFAPNIQIDWNKSGSDKYSVPIGIGVDKLVMFGKLPVKFGVEVYHYVKQNDQFGADFGIRFFAMPVVPKLF
ncbi:MAG: hypothetical protein P8M49_13695 [Thalassotalea sp.]|nr:hypothetical protein [Thalassotalea sp.]MDG2394564.1 hypothetical protein [Thalassotalea sp.]